MLTSDQDGLLGAIVKGDRLKIMTHSNSDRLEKIDC